MSGAGSATLAFAQEGSFLGTPGDFYSFGRNPTVNDLNLDNQLTRLREAGVIQSVESVKGNFEGAFGVSATINSATHDEVEHVVFNDGGSGFTTGRAQSAEVRAGVEHLDTTGTTTKVRTLKGVVPTDYEISYTQGGLVEYSLTCLYADEDDGTEPSTVTSPTGGGDAAFHNFTLDIDGATVSKLQEATLSFSTLYRFQRDADPTAVDAVLAKPEATLDVEAVYEGADRLELAYGSAGATTPEDRLSAVSASVDVTVGGTTISTYTLPQVKPATYDWTSLLDGDTDTADQTTFNVSGQVSVA